MEQYCDKIGMHEDFFGGEVRGWGHRVIKPVINKDHKLPWSPELVFGFPLTPSLCWTCDLMLCFVTQMLNHLILYYFWGYVLQAGVHICSVYECNMLRTLASISSEHPSAKSVLAPIKQHGKCVCEVRSWSSSTDSKWLRSVSTASETRADCLTEGPAVWGADPF